MFRPLLAACLLTVPAAAAPKPAEKAPIYYHPVRVGDTLVYEARDDRPGASVTEHAESVTKVEETAGRLRVTVDRHAGGVSTDVVLVSAAGVSTEGAGGAECPILKVPAKVGDAWTPTRGGVGPAGMTYTVAAVDEAVEVPAGKFRAIRVEAASTVRGVRMTWTRWYVPGIGAVKSVLSADGKARVQVLKSFTPAK